MRLTRLQVENLFSFERLDLDLGADATVLLGPNGSGKTNVFRAIDLAATALRWAAAERPVPGPPPTLGPAGQSLQTYFGMSHEGRAGRRRVEVGLELDQEDEVSLLASFLRAALTWSVREELHGSSADSPIEDWVSAEITPERVACLTQGTLVAEHSGVPRRSWEVGYDFEPGPGGSRCRWILAAPSRQDWIVRLDEDGPTPQRSSPSSGLLQGLFGIPLGSPPPHLPHPLPPFDLDQAVGADAVGPITLGRQVGSVVDWSSPTALEFLTRFGAPPPPTDILSTEQTWTLAKVLLRLWQEQVFTVGEQLRGVGRWGEPVAAVGSYDLEQLASAATTSETPLLPARLFRLLNGSAEERRRFEEIQSLFCRLTGGRHLAVRAIPLPSRPVPDPSGGGSTVPPKGAGGLYLEVLVREGPTATSVGAWEAPIQSWGAGTWEALVLAEALSGPSGRVVLLDEPATNLHPSWQQVLRRELTRGDADQTGSAPQVVVITHAPDLVPLTTVSGVALIRATRAEGASRVRPISSSTLSAVGGKLAAKGNHRLLFVDQAILVEGERDRAVIQTLARRLALPIEGAHSAVLECGGRTNLPSYMGLCKELGIRHLVVTDRDSTTAGSDEATRQHADSVRKAIAPGLGTLFEFEEDMEQAFGLPSKQSHRRQPPSGEPVATAAAPPTSTQPISIPSLVDLAGEIDLEGASTPEEVKRLCSELRKFAASLQSPPHPGRLAPQ